MSLKSQYTTANGRTIFVTPSARHHLAAHPEVSAVLEEAMLRLDPIAGRFLRREVDLGRVLGRSGCVETRPIAFDEPALFAQRIGRQKPSRVIVGAPGPECRTVVIIAQPNPKRDGHNLMTAYVGTLAPREPWDPSLRPSEKITSVKFWCRHALVYDESVMDPPERASWKDILQR